MLALKVLVSAVCQHLACMGTCFGTCTKSTTVLSVDQATKSQNLQRSRRRGQSLTEKDIWTSSSNDMDNFTKNSRSSQRSLSSLSTTNPILETHGANNNASSVAFVNHGLMLWNEQRRDWTGNRLRSRSSQPCEPAISWTSTYEDLLGTSRPFVKPISLREMVSFLVGVWEHEGLYD